MLTVENEYFIRLLLLILKGGTAVQKKVLIERLRKDDMQLKDFLLSNQKEIDKLKEDKVLTLKQYNILFPSNGTPSDFNNYDISLLSCLLLNIFSLTLTKRQEKAIQNIRTLRNEFLAHHPNDSIDVRTFFRKWNQLHQSIDNLRQDLSDETSQELEDIIRCVVNDPIDIKQAIQDIKVATDNSDLFIEHVSRQLENLSVLVQRIYRHQEDTCTAIEELQKQNENRNMSCVIIGEVTVSSKNPEAAIEAAKILLENSKASTESITNKDTVVNNGRTTKIVKSINSSFDGLLATSATTTESTDTDSSSQSSEAALVQDINDTGGEVVHVTEGSVLLHIQCNSVLVVFNVLNFFKSSTMEQRLNTIAECLSHKVGSCIQLSAHIQEESLCETLRFLQQNEHPEYMKKVRFSIKYQSMEGVLKVVKLMEGEEWKNDITAVSKFLSDEVGCPVTLSASLDKVPLQQYIVEAREHDNDKESAEKAEMLCWADARGNEKEKEMDTFAAVNRPKEFMGEKEDTIVDMSKIQIDTQVTSIVKGEKEDTIVDMPKIQIDTQATNIVKGEKEDTIVDMPKIQIDTQVTSIVKGEKEDTIVDIPKIQIDTQATNIVKEELSEKVKIGMELKKGFWKKMLCGGVLIEVALGVTYAMSHTDAAKAVVGAVQDVVTITAEDVAKAGVPSKVGVVVGEAIVRTAKSVVSQVKWSSV